MTGSWLWELTEYVFYFWSATTGIKVLYRTGDHSIFQVRDAMKGHWGFVLARCFDASGKTLYSVSVEGSILAWNVHTSAIQQSWKCHKGPINALAYHCRTKESAATLVTAGHDQTVALWDASDGSLLGRLTGHKAGVHSVAISDQFVISGSADKLIGIRDRKTGHHVDWLQGHDDVVTGIAFLDENRIVSGSRDCSLRVWDLSKRTQELVLEGHTEWVTKVGVGRGSQAVSVSEDGTLRIWDCTTGAELWSHQGDTGHGHPLWGLGINQAGTFAIVMAARFVARVDLVKLNVELSHKPITATARGIGVSPVENLVALGCDSGDVDLYDINRKSVVSTLKSNVEAIGSAIISASDSVVGNLYGRIKVSVQDKTLILASAHNSFVYCIQRIDELRFASGAFDHLIRIWDFKTASSLIVLDHGGAVFSLSTPDDVSRLLSAGGNRLILWDINTQKIIWQMQGVGPGSHNMAAINGRGDIVVSVSEEAILKLWHLGDGSSTVLPLPQKHTSAVGFLKDQERVITGNANGEISVIDLKTGVSTLLHNHHEDWVRTLRISADGIRILTVSQNGTACVFDIQQNRIISPVSDQPVAVADFDKNGQVYWVDNMGRVY
ncbi:MAG: WD40 repeat domain-containing protein [bacterium]